MPLISLKTNLKDIKFGRDRLNGGSSNQPYIKSPVPGFSAPIGSEYTPEPFNSFYKANATTHDFPIRGGGLLEQMSNGLGTQTIAGQIDRDRIEKFLKDGERGPAFIRKQIGLQLSNPLMQTAEVNPSFKLAETMGLIQNTRLFNNGRNLLTSVQYAGTGVFLNRNGALPFNPNEKYYAATMREERLLDPKKVEGINRLLILRNLKLTNAKDPIANVIDFSMINKLGISTNKNVLFDYLGGPGSVYGVGATTIRRARDWDTSRTTVETSAPGGPDGYGVKMNFLTFTYDQIMAQSQSVIANGRITAYSDFRDQLPDKSAFKKLNGSWKTDNIDRYLDSGADKINLSDMIVSKNHDTDPFKNPIDQSGKNDDLIKFAFECIDNDETGDTTLYFRALLGSITDSHKASWNSFKYMGRGENFYTYQGVDRSFTTSFKIALFSDRELNVTYNKLNYLISQVYPDYNSKTQFMRGPLMRLTIGDYLYRAYGFLENIDITVDQNSTWEITDGQQLPHVLNVSFGYKIIEKTLPQRGKAGENYTNFIGNSLYQTNTNALKQSTQINSAGIARDDLTNQTQQTLAGRALVNRGDMAGRALVNRGNVG